MIAAPNRNGSVNGYPASSGWLIDDWCVTCSTTTAYTAKTRRTSQLILRLDVLAGGGTTSAAVSISEVVTSSQCSSGVTDNCVIGA
ncbi:hypothetical protein GCM10029964_095160 [Kibdelosporangium lantanae]